VDAVVVAVCLQPVLSGHFAGETLMMDSYLVAMIV
jgi:hypothetical protein